MLWLQQDGQFLFQTSNFDSLTAHIQLFIADSWFRNLIFSANLQIPTCLTEQIPCIVKYIGSLRGKFQKYSKPIFKAISNEIFLKMIFWSEYFIRRPTFNTTIFNQNQSLKKLYNKNRLLYDSSIQKLTYFALFQNIPLLECKSLLKSSYNTFQI